MIEVSFIEIALLCYGILVTGIAFKFRAEARDHQRMVQLILEEPKVRKEMVQQYEEWKAENVN